MDTLFEIHTTSKKGKSLPIRAHYDEEAAVADALVAKNCKLLAVEESDDGVTTVIRTDTYVDGEVVEVNDESYVRTDEPTVTAKPDKKAAKAEPTPEELAAKEAEKTAKAEAKAAAKAEREAAKAAKDAEKAAAKAEREAASDEIRAKRADLRAQLRGLGRTANATNHKYHKSSVITVLVDNPKRPGTDAHRHFSAMTPGMTVGEYTAIVGPKGLINLHRDFKEGRVDIEGMTR
jgi:hypothetical protein